MSYGLENKEQLEESGMRMLMALIDLTIYPKKSKLGLALFERWETLRDLGGVYSSQW